MDTNIKRENLAMKIVLLRDKQTKGKISFNEMLKEAVKLISEYESDMMSTAIKT